MSQKPLHPVQESLLGLLAEHTHDPLTIRELQERVGASSTSVVTHHLSQLEKKGYLKRNPYNPRDYQVLDGDPESKVALVNLYGLASCGPGQSILESDPIDRIPLASRLLSFPIAEAFMVKAKGKSMEPRISEGDLVIARRASVPRNGRVHVCVDDEMVVIKLLHVSEGKVFLASFNADFRPYPAHEDFKVEGEVKSIISGKI